MARPRLGTSASRRLQMVIAADELKVIDDWWHEHRFASRSEAIRYLCKLALVWSEHNDAERREWMESLR